MIFGNSTTMILCDVKGTRIDDRVPWEDYLNNFKLAYLKASGITLLTSD
ncbi:hypothetical protein AtEden1_Chr4g0279981 [Arabidopsis thaliana]